MVGSRKEVSLDETTVERRLFASAGVRRQLTTRVHPRLPARSAARV